MVGYGATPAIEAGAVAEPAAGVEPADAGDFACRPPGRGWTWAQLMRRAFALDVLACSACGGRLRLMGLIFDPHTVRAILDSAGAPATLADRAPPADPPTALAAAVPGASA